MARLPNPGSDDGNWGTILNDFLSQSLDSGGAIKVGTIGTNNLANGAVTSPKLSAGTPTSGQVLSYNGSSMVWTTPNASTTPDATANTKGLVQLAGDLGGTASAPTVPGLATLQTSLNSKAPLASPTFSGTVSVPTPVNNTDAATKAYVDAHSSSGVGLGSATPLSLGTAAAGTSTSAAHEDHVHPTTGLALATNGGAENIVNVNNATGTAQLNLANGNVFNVTLTGDVTFSFTGNLNNQAAAFTVYLSQNSTGNHNVVWPGGVLWPGGIIPTLTSSANAIDILVFETLNGSLWFGALVGANYH